MNIVIFINAAHQRRYVTVLKSAMRGVEHIKVHAVDTSLFERKTEGSNESNKDHFIVRKRRRTEQRFALLRFVKALLGLLRRSLLFTFLSVHHWQRYLEKRLFSLQPDLIVLLEDNAEGLTGLVSHAARKKKIPFVILPDYIPNPAEPARYYFSDPLHSAETFAGKLIATLAPRWVIEYDGKRLLRLPPNQIFLQLIRRQHCPQPWILNAGYSETILLESRSSSRHYESLGFKPAKLRIIGGAVEDELHVINAERQRWRSRLYSQYNLDRDKPLVICGFPPDQYTASTEGFEFKTYDELCRNWFEVFGSVSDRANILIVRHPRTDFDVLSRFATEGVHIATEPLERIIPLADLYVASISTTIRWALCLAIPVMNYDTYRYDYGDFSTARGCLEVTDLNAFRQGLERMLQPVELERLKAVAAADAREWGIVDGNFRTRLRDVLEEITRNYRGAPSLTHKEAYRLREFT